MKTKDTCKKCGGHCKPSKGYINFHNIQFPHDNSKAEFETKLLDCLKCEDCGHSFIPQNIFKVGDTVECIKSFTNPETDTRVEVGHRFKLFTQFYVDSLSQPHNWRVVEETNSKPIRFIGGETLALSVGLKPNSKTFTQFNEELFLKYVSKFSDSDKAKALKVIYDNLDGKQLFKGYLLFE